MKQKVSVNKDVWHQKRKNSDAPAGSAHSKWTSFVFTQTFYTRTKASNLHTLLALTCTINQNISNGTSWYYRLKCPQTPDWEKFVLSSPLNYGLLQKQGYITPRRGIHVSVYIRRCSDYWFIVSTAKSFHLRLYTPEIMDHQYHPFETQTVPVYTNANPTHQ